MYQFARLALVVLALLWLGPTGAWANDRMGGSPGLRMGGSPGPRMGSTPGLRMGGTPGSISRPHHRPSRPIARPLPVVGIGCCLDGGYFPPAPPPVFTIPPPPPTVYVIVPSPPSLVYVPTPRVEPAPEVTLPTGRWARHGNGREYPYVWVWAGPAPERER